MTIPASEMPPPYKKPNLDFSHNPVDEVRWVPIGDVEANDYNPNSVAKTEMKLLYISIKNDGYTQPIVTVWDPERKKYVVVDGFHRRTVSWFNKDILDGNYGLVPVVVLHKTLAERMASTVRHNRARGRHSVSGMATLVFSMLEEGMTDAQVCNALGMSVEELARLKHITGFSKLFQNVEYRQAWETKMQIRARKEWEAKGPNASPITDSVPEPGLPHKRGKYKKAPAA